jgi:hypothetical protein
MSVACDITTRRGREWVREFTGRRVASLPPEEAKRAHVAGYEPDGEYLIGRDLRAMERAELEAMGHALMSPVEAIRTKVDCAGSSDEARKCVAVACPSWPFCRGKNPWRSVSEARRETGRRLAARMHQKSTEA